MPESLDYTPRSAWRLFSGAGEHEKMMDFARAYIDFISLCKTERECVAQIRKRLLDASFSGDCTLQNGRFFRELRGKTLFAARKGRRPLGDGLALIAAHVDSPRLDLKQRPLVENGEFVLAKTHYYGGLRKYQWLALPLALHGVIIGESRKRIDVRIGEEPDDPQFCIADLLPHLAQKQNEQKVSEAFEGEKLNIILAHGDPEGADAGEADSRDRGKGIKNCLLRLLHEKYGICEEDLVSAELEAVPAGRARLLGFDRSMVGGYGQDDRICAYTALEAFAAVEDPEYCSALIFWDKEEIGSDGATGASSRFLQYCIEELARKWQPGCPAGEIMLASRALSADVQAGLDPDFQELHDAQNAARLGFGPCFSKYTGSRGKYGSSDADAEFFGELRSLFNKKGLPWQAAELGKVDSGGGGTVALFLAALGMQVIDLGPALLSMHSPFEISSCADIYATWLCYRAFLEGRA